MAVAWQSESNAKTSNGAVLTLTKPAGTVDGDLLIVEVSNQNPIINAAVSGTWTKFVDVQTGVDPNADMRQQLYWRVANAEPVSYTVTMDSAVTVEAAIWRVNGQDANNPIDSKGSATGVGTTVTAPSITTINANTLLGYFGVSKSVTANSFPAPAGMTQREDFNTSAHTWSNASVAFAGPGATGTKSAAVNALTTDPFIASLIAIAPAPTPVAPPIGTQLNRGTYDKFGKPKSHLFFGWTYQPLFDEATGDANVCNYLDIPTVDRRHSQIVFAGYAFPGVRDDNAPDFVMPQPWWELPNIRVKRGNSYVGCRTPDPIKFEFEMAGQHTTLPPTKPRLNRDYMGKAVTQFFLDAPEEIHGKRVYDVPMRGGRFLWSRQAMSQWSVLPIGTGTGNVTPAVVPQQLTLMFVGNANTPGSLAIPAIPNPLMDVPTPAALMRSKSKTSYQGHQYGIVPLDSFMALGASYDVPQRRNYKFDVKGWQFPLVGLDSLQVNSQVSDLPVRRLRPDYSGWQSVLIGADSLNIFTQASDIPVRRKRGTNEGFTFAGNVPDAVVAGGMALGASFDLPRRKKIALDPSYRQAAIPAAIAARVGSFTLRGTTGSQSITGLGFTPKAVIFFASEQLLVSSNNESRWTFGCATGASNQWAQCTSFNLFGSGSGSLDCQFRSSKCFAWNDAAADIAQIEADFTSLDADGFTINVTQAAAKTINFIALGGSGLSALAGKFDMTTATGSQAVTGVGFQPKATIMGFPCLNNTDTPDIVIGPCIGIALSSANRGTLAQCINDLNPSNIFGSLLNNQCLTAYDGNGTALVNADFTSNDSGGFTINKATAPTATTRVGYLCLGGASLSVALQDITEPASTGNQTTSGLGFTPVALMTLSNGEAASTTANHTYRQTTGAASDPAAQASISTDIAQASSAFTTYPAVTDFTTECFDTCSTSGSTTSDAKLQSMQRDSFTLNWTKVSGNSSNVKVFTLGA